LILGMFSPNSVVGVYGTMKSIVDVFVTIIRTISRVFFPLLNRNAKYFKRFAQLIISVSIFCWLSILILNKWLPTFFNVYDSQAPQILFILACGLPFLAMYQCYGTNYFLVKRQDAIVVKNTIISSLIGFILSFPLIIFWGGSGAALNLTFCRALMGGGL